MKVIHNKEEFEKTYDYKHKPHSYPKKYPCVMLLETNPFSIEGVIDHKVAYPPEGVDAITFIKCINSQWETL
jgi:hypothetical protein